MWNKRKEEEYAPRPSGPSFPHALPDRETGEPLAPAIASGRASAADSVRAGFAMIGKSVTVQGQIYSREDLTIDGEVEGTIEAQEHRITVGPNGRVRATVKAREIVILGQLYGNIEAGDRVEIRRDAKLVGDVRSVRIAIEDGAWFKGSIDIVRPETAKADRKPATPATVSTAATQPPAVASDAPNAGPPKDAAPAEMNR